MKKPVLFILLISLTAAAYFIFKNEVIAPSENREPAQITTFEECAAKYPVMGSYPRQCNTPDGKHFVENIVPQEKNKEFRACTAAGNPVTESYPSVCKTPEGKRITEDIGNEVEMANEIKTDYPTRNQIITSPITITGQARGNWYFEAQFPVKLNDGNFREIAHGIAAAKGEWMTENFVPFTAIIEFEKPITEMGYLILKNDNPSGLPENDKQLIVPVKFQ